MTTPTGRGEYIQSVDSGKRSMVRDLENEDGASAFLHLVPVVSVDDPVLEFAAGDRVIGNPSPGLPSGSFTEFSVLDQNNAFPADVADDIGRLDDGTTVGRVVLVPLFPPAGKAPYETSCHRFHRPYPHR